MRKSLVIAALFTLASLGSDEAVAQQTNATATPQEIEQIFIARSVRDSVTAPTEFCGKANSGVNEPNSESQFSFRSVVTRASDGRVIDAESTTMGNIHACFGSAANPGTLEFYGEGTIAGVAYKGFGDCIITRPDFPEKGLTVFRCYLSLRDLPDGYIGGQLTTNTIVSKNRLGMQTDPSGYRQFSIATIRLWKKRGEM